MMEQKRSDRASARPTRPAPECNDEQSEVEDSREESPPTPDVPPGTSTGERPLNDVEDGLAFLREVEEYFKDVDPGKHKAFVDLLVAKKHAEVGQPCFISQVKELFRGHKEMLELFNEILQPDHKILFKEDVPEVQDLAKLYVVKVKTRSSTSVYTTFMLILNLYNERALSSDEVDREVEVLFAESCDLLEEYDCFRPERAAPVVQSPLHPRHMHSALEVSKLQREQQRERLQRMCEEVSSRKRKEKGKGVVTERKQQPPPPPPKRVSPRLANASNALGNRRTSRSSTEAHPRRPTDSAIASATLATMTPDRSRSPVSEDAKYNGRAMCSPSYLLLKPSKNGDGEGRAEVSVHRSELAKSVLNEECQLVPQRNFEERTLNPYEEALFKCEMNQYEYDMLIRKFEATINSFMTYLLKREEPNSGELPRIREILSTMHKRCIEHLYGQHTQAIMEALDENPDGALRVLLNRLILKLKLLLSDKAMITPTWSQVYKDNFYLSLHHQFID